jgi:hypothetical protein
MNFIPKKNNEKFNLEEGLHYFLRYFRGIGTWAKCPSRHKTGTDYQKTSPYRPVKVHYKHFTVPVLDESDLISASHVPGKIGGRWILYFFRAFLILQSFKSMIFFQELSRYQKRAQGNFLAYFGIPAHK